jgi:hypothetical protein
MGEQIVAQRTPKYLMDDPGEEVNMPHDVFITRPNSSIGGITNLSHFLDGPNLSGGFANACWGTGSKELMSAKPATRNRSNQPEKECKKGAERSS